MLTLAMVGEFPIPDPRAWPAEAKARFKELTGACESLDVHIFVSNSAAVMLMADAVTALGILDVDPSEWHVEGGYPAFQFSPERVREYSRRLTQCGYRVHIVGAPEMAGQNVEKTRRAEVVEITSARRGRKTV